MLLYCTGGIRCEKAAQFFAGLPVPTTGATDVAVARPASVRQLRGGIVAYARDVLGEVGVPELSSVSLPTGDAREKEGPHSAVDPSSIAGGRSIGSDNSGGGGVGSVCGGVGPLEKVSSLFQGCNFVFDNRGTVRVTTEVTAWCDGCGAASNALGKCASEGCHTILIVCGACSRQKCTPPADSNDSVGQGDCSGGARSGASGQVRFSTDGASDVCNAGGGAVYCCSVCKEQDDERRTSHSGGNKRRRPCNCDNYGARARRLLPHPPPPSPPKLGEQML